MQERCASPDVAIFTSRWRFLPYLLFQTFKQIVMYGSTDQHTCGCHSSVDHTTCSQTHIYFFIKQNMCKGQALPCLIAKDLARKDLTWLHNVGKIKQTQTAKDLIAFYFAISAFSQYAFHKHSLSIVCWEFIKKTIFPAFCFFTRHLIIYSCVFIHIVASNGSWWWKILELAKAR